MDTELSRTFGTKIDSFEYRGFKVDFFEDILGHQIVAFWENALYQFGVMNTTYREDMKLVINEKLDTITRFEEYPVFYGAKLEYFQNAGFRDARLSYRGRVLMIYREPEDLDLPSILRAAKELLAEEIRIRNETDS